MRSFILTAVFCLFAATTAVAREHCTVISLKDDYKRSAFVLTGEALHSPTGMAYFRVLRVWKGRLGSEVQFDSSQFQRFEPGATYLLFAYKGTNGRPYLHDCSHSASMSIDYVEREISTLSARYRWWNCPISSIGLHSQPGPP